MGKEDSAIVVFTADSVETILRQGGSGDWVVSAKKADTCKYIVCCRKPNWSNRKEGIPARAAFLIGRVAGLRQSADRPTPRDQMRYLIKMADYAVFEKPPVVWRDDVRNPVGYSTLDELQIDLRELEFKPMPAGAGSNESFEAKQMTIADAKNGLAATFGVNPDDIEIIIRG